MAHKLLVADDSITIQRVIELTFAEEDVQVVAVGDGKHAIDRIETDRPDIVLADVGMPERDGYEVAAFVKGNPHLAHIPVLLLTGAFEPIDENRARAAGCDGVLVKPFEPQMVINRVKDLLAGKKPAGSGNSNSTEPRGPALPPQESYVPRAANQSDSLEEYFDRLDAAFATLATEPGAPSTQILAPPASQTAVAEQSTTVDFASWDPDLTDEARPAVVPAPMPLVQAPPPAAVPVAPILVDQAPTLHLAPPVAPVAPVAPVPLAAPVPVAEIPVIPSPAPVAPALSVSLPPAVSLAEAFATLLAAEHGQVIAPTAPRQPAPDVVEDIVRRVLGRLDEDDMRRTVLDVAERLVREEIDRIKRTHG